MTEISEAAKVEMGKLLAGLPLLEQDLIALTPVRTAA